MKQLLPLIDADNADQKTPKGGGATRALGIKQ
jgi:hypothetical protein